MVAAEPAAVTLLVLITLLVAIAAGNWQCDADRAHQATLCRNAAYSASVNVWRHPLSSQAVPLELHLDAAGDQRHKFVLARSITSLPRPLRIALTI